MSPERCLAAREARGIVLGTLDAWVARTDMRYQVSSQFQTMSIEFQTTPYSTLFQTRRFARGRFCPVRDELYIVR